MKPMKLIALTVVAACSLTILSGCAGVAPSTSTAAPTDAALDAAAPRMTTAQSTRQLKIARGANNRQLVAHRGLKSVYPENTLPAFENSSRRGYWGVEFDVYETSDGEWVVMHDNTVDRTTSGTGQISGMTLAQIKALIVDVGAGIENYPDLKVPTLAEALAVFARYKAIPVIEVKASTERGYDTFVALLRQYGLEDRTIVASFTPTILDGVRSRSPSIPLMLLGDITSRNIDWCAARLPSLISTPHELATVDLVREARQKGVSVVPFVVDSLETKARLMAYGADLVTTGSLAQDTPGASMDAELAKPAR